MDPFSFYAFLSFCQKHFGSGDISNGLRSATGNLNHLGIKTAPSNLLLACQNGKRDADLFKDLYFKLLEQLGQHTKKNDKTQNKSSCLFIRFHSYFSIPCLYLIGQHIELKRSCENAYLTWIWRETSCLCEYYQRKCCW